MKRLVAVYGVVIVLLFGGCKKDDQPSGTQQQTGVPLTATPSSVTVSVGTSVDVSIGNGTPPYGIASGSGSIATVVLVNRDSLVATVSITGVTVASAATSVTVKDNSVPPVRTVTIPIFVH